MSLPPVHPQKTASGIAVDPRTLNRVVPESRRKDGSIRKEIKIRPGFTPQEDLTRFRGSRQQQMDRITLPKGHILGWVTPRAESKPTPAGEGATSKSAKKNERRKEKRNKVKDEIIKANWEDDEDKDGAPSRGATSQLEDKEVQEKDGEEGSATQDKSHVIKDADDTMNRIETAGQKVVEAKSMIDVGNDEKQPAQDLDSIEDKLVRLKAAGQLPPVHPQKTASGIAVDPRTLNRVVSESRRKDGSIRKEIRIRPGFTPQEDLTRFRGSRQQQMDRITLPKGHILGWVTPRAESKPTPAGEGATSKSAKKNEKRKESNKVKDEIIKANCEDDEDKDGAPSRGATSQLEDKEVQEKDGEEGSATQDKSHVNKDADDTLNRAETAGQKVVEVLEAKSMIDVGDDEIQPAHDLDSIEDTLVRLKV